MKLSEYLKQLRSTHGYKQEYVASYLNIRRQAYTAYETGQNNPSVSSIKKMAELYHVPVDTFINKLPDKYVSSTDSDYIADAADDSQDYMDMFFQYVEKNSEKLKNFTYAEKLLLYLYSCLDMNGKNEIISYMNYKVNFEKKDSNHFF